jgi:hypothetical protein
MFYDSIAKGHLGKDHLDHLCIKSRLQSKVLRSLAQIIRYGRYETDISFTNYKRKERLRQTLGKLSILI